MPRGVEFLPTDQAFQREVLARAEKDVTVKSPVRRVAEYIIEEARAGLQG